MNDYTIFLVQINDGNEYKTLCWEEKAYIPIYWEMLIAAGNYDFSDENHLLSIETSIKQVEPYLDYYQKRNMPKFAQLEFKNFLYRIKGYQLKITISKLYKLFIKQVKTYGLYDKTDLENFSNRELLKRIIEMDFEHNFFPTLKAETFDDLEKRFGLVKEDYQTPEYIKYKEFKNPQNLQNQIQKKKVNIYGNIFKIIFFIICWVFSFFVIRYSETAIGVLISSTILGIFFSSLKIYPTLKKVYKYFCYIPVAILALYMFTHKASLKSLVFLWHAVIVMIFRFHSKIAYFILVYLFIIGLGMGFSTSNCIKLIFKYKRKNISLKNKLEKNLN